MADPRERIQRAIAEAKAQGALSQELGERWAEDVLILARAAEELLDEHLIVCTNCRSVGSWPECPTLSRVVSGE